VEGLAYDWVAENLYWLDSKLNIIEVATSQGQNRMILVNQNISQPRGLSLDPSEDSRSLIFILIPESTHEINLIFFFQDGYFGRIGVNILDLSGLAWMERNDLSS